MGLFVDSVTDVAEIAIFCHLASAMLGNLLL